MRLTGGYRGSQSAFKARARGMTLSCFTLHLLMPQLSNFFQASAPLPISEEAEKLIAAFNFGKPVRLKHYQVLWFAAWALQNPEGMVVQLHDAGGLEYYISGKKDTAYFLFLKTKFLMSRPEISSDQFQAVRENAGNAFNEAWWKEDQ